MSAQLPLVSAPKNTNGACNRRSGRRIVAFPIILGQWLRQRGYKVEELEAAGLNIPYPQTDVHLHHQNPLKEIFKD